MSAVRFPRLLLALGPALLLACATARPMASPADEKMSARVQAPGLLFELRYTRRDGEDVARIGSGLLAAGPRLSRWGAFRQGIFIQLFSDHQSLEAAIDRRGYPWLRAWAYGDQILLQSPRTWNAASGAALDEELGELLAHELTHSLMYQLMEPDDGPLWTADAPLEEPPLWFREGMASVTAGQGHRRLSAEEMARWIAEHPGVDVLHPSPEVYREEKEAVYGAAHRAFDLLLGVAGDQSVRDIFRGVRAGARFADAFKAATGHGLAEFEREAVRSGFDAAAARLKAASGAGGP
jgi:hypothetical protein